MKIAYFVSNRTTLPPHKDQIAASTSVVLNLITNLSSKHEITVFAAKGSHIPGVNMQDLDLPAFELDANTSQDDWITKYTLGMKSLYLGSLFEQASSFDLIHLHTEPIYLGMAFARLIHTPVLFTSHNTIHSYEVALFNRYLKSGISLSGLSFSQVNELSAKKDIPIIYNGIQARDLPFVQTVAKNAPFLFLGRFNEDKGVDIFLTLVKKQVNVPFSLAGKGVQWENTIREASVHSSNLLYKGMLGYMSDSWKDTLSSAKALIMPIRYEDTCPLVPLEAMACGTPVIAFARGALPEQIVDGKTGFLVNFSDSDKRGDWIIKKTGIDGLMEAMERINTLSDEDYKSMRAQSRAHVEEKFNVKRMVDQYEKLYLKMIK